MSICTVCKREQAIYYHRFSGDYLCAKCLKRRLVKYIKKAFKRYGLAGPKIGEIALVIPQHHAQIAPALIELVDAAERGHATTLHLLIPQSLSSNVLENLKLSLNIGVIRHYTLKQNYYFDAQVRMLRYVAAKESKTNTIIMPMMLEEGLLCLLSALARAKPAYIDCVKPKIEVANKVILNPFLDVSIEDVYAYAQAKKGLSRIEVERQAYFLEDLLPAIFEDRGPELRYSYRKVAFQLLDALKVRLESLVSKCRRCGGLEVGYVERGVCRVCQRLEVDSNTKIF